MPSIIRPLVRIVKQFLAETSINKAVDRLDKSAYNFLAKINKGGYRDQRKEKAVYHDSNPGGYQRHLRKLMAERGIENELQLAQVSGLHNTAIYRGFSGARPWNLDQLEIIARSLKVPLSALFQGPLVVPLVGMAKDGHGPPQESITNPKPTGFLTYQMENMTDLAQLYSLEVADNSMAPILRQGAYLIAQRDTADSIKQHDLVVFWDSDDRTLIRQIHINGDHIILKNLTPGGTDKVLPKRYLAACDRIRRIDFPA